MNKLNFSKHLEIKDVKINDKFWNNITELVRTEVIPYQYLALQDKIEGAEKSFCIDNFIKAKTVKHKILQGSIVKKYPVDKWHYTENNSEPESFKGWVFQDSDVYKWIEAVGYSLQNFPDSELERKALEYIDIICDALLENGYLDTLYIINDIDKAFTNLKDHHELYCFGHLAEGAVSFYNATGNDKLLKTACRFADLICDTFGEDKIKGYDGHEICEMALFKLYKATGTKKYLDTALFFINERGKKPYYYDKEKGIESDGENYHYNQAHIPPRKQTEAVGHAVRGVYLYSAMADLAKELNDDELKKACESIWDNIENKKMYITGGIGATVDGEAFSFDYDLPNDLAYSETCASIGLIFFARRMSEMSIDSKYSDVIERALYNTVLSGMGEDGKSFFYVNPLEVLPLASHSDSRKRHIKPVRQKWFGCACCPPNLARLISSLNEYIYNENDNTIFVNQYISSSAVTKHGNINLKENNGGYTLTTDFSNKVKIALRIPYWCDNFELNHSFEIINGYAVFTAINESVEIKLNAKPKIIRCSNRVRANVGKAAVTYGPFIYCLEEADNGCDLQMLSIDISKQPALNYDVICAEGYREIPDGSLYMNYCEPRKEKCTLKFIPYYKWGNRGENEMCIYVRVLNEKEL
ncbi:MAG: glycoside hydrolase family 127 protein [Eubacterium sp.]|nr:glycoside hydrolase family 127 protein [Eubacterium sp.]